MEDDRPPTFGREQLVVAWMQSFYLGRRPLKTEAMITYDGAGEVAVQSDAWMDSS